MTYRILGITGSRPHKFPDGLLNAVREKVVERIAGFAAQGGEQLLQGGAQGVDTWAALAGLEHGLDIITYVPFPQQADSWGQQDKEVYQHILDSSKEVKVFGESAQNRYYFQRNSAIVANSDIMLAASVAGQKGGANHTAQLAQKQGKALIWLRVDQGVITQDFFASKNTPYLV